MEVLNIQVLSSCHSSQTSVSLLEGQRWWCFYYWLNLWRCACLAVPELAIRLLPSKMLKGSILLCPFISLRLSPSLSQNVCSAVTLFTRQAAAEVFLSNIGGSWRWSLRCSGQRRCKGKKIQLLGMPLQWPSNISVQDLLTDCVLFLFQGCCVLESGTHIVWGSFVTVLPSSEFPANKMVWLLFQSSIWSATTEGGPLGMSVNISLASATLISSFQMVSEEFSYAPLSLCVQIGWPTTAQALWNLSSIYCNAKRC